MAELVDALDSGSSEGSFIQVQVLLSAPKPLFGAFFLFYGIKTDKNGSKWTKIVTTFVTKKRVLGRKIGFVTSFVTKNAAISAAKMGVYSVQKGHDGLFVGVPKVSVSFQNLLGRVPDQ